MRDRFKLYAFLAVLFLFVVVPFARSKVQEISIIQDIQSIAVEYSMLGRDAFRTRLDEVLRRARLDPSETKVEIKENRRESWVKIEVRYISRMKILFVPFDRPVVIRREITLYSLD